MYIVQHALSTNTVTTQQQRQQYQLSYNAPISPSKKFLQQLKNHHDINVRHDENEQGNCIKDDDVDDESTAVNNNIATDILTFINHIIIENLWMDEDEDTKDEIIVEEGIKELIIDAKQKWLNNKETTQKHCMMVTKQSALCMLSYNNKDIVLSTSLKVEKDDINNDKLIISFDTNLSANNSNNNMQEILVSSVSALDELFNDFLLSSSLWTIHEKSMIGDNSSSGQNNDDVSFLFKEKMLSNPNLEKKRIYHDKEEEHDNDAIEIWEFNESNDSTTSTKALFINSNLKHLSNNANNDELPLSSSKANAEAFIHPSILNHPYPTRIAIISKTPLLHMQEILKYESIKAIDIIGTNVMQLKNVINIIPELNDCSGFEGIDEHCMNNTDIISIIDQDVNDWIDVTIMNEEEKDEERYKYDIIYIDSPSSSSKEEIDWLSVSFIKRLTDLLDFREDASMIVINSGHAPTTSISTSTPTASTKSEQLRYELLKVASQRKKREIDHEAIVIYDEPLANPLNSAYIILFHRAGESYERFFRERPTSFDIDIITNLRTTTNNKPPTALYDGPTHERYKRPSRTWEKWFCNTPPWKEYYLCTTFYNQFFNKEYHHFNTVVRDHPIKNRALYTTTKVKEGHFINANDDSTLLHIDSYQWENLNEFVKVIPSATMYKELKDFINAYGFETDILGLTGWSVSMTSNQTFTNHACTELDSTVTGLEKAFETDEDSKYNNYVAFNPAIQRRASLFAVLSVATRDLDIGAELMVDYTSFRDTVDDDFQAFLDKICNSGVGLVPNKDEEEGHK